MPLNLIVTIDPDSGFCFGVKKAVQKVEKALSQVDQVYCLGHIVHNHMEVNRLEGMGMKTINHDDLQDLHGKTILIRAHGEPPSTYDLIEKNNNILIEASCPVVLKLQDRIRQTHTDGDYILIFGKKSHPEVKGLLGQIFENVQAFENVQDLDFDKLPNRVVLYSQTTKDTEELYAKEDELVKLGYEVVLKDTVCRQVSGRKKKLQEFAMQSDVLIMVAGSESSNGKVLHAQCKLVNHNSYKLNAVEEILPEWFTAGQSVGISGATSTPQWLMEEVAEYIRAL
ncbi:MAG: 4-hydroxy-3-methylbut-2-enyl diphosphate reductase [Bacteroidetes bacterium]|jgi:4-hydroxy-3-methylbut-2-en-1-yl diphosphate reductase|nr:4-hydroxy-3-methylbut-2-enyl diphosphate reductase [Bacteroidota bacterium]MBT4401069.1 4-hydroxy-3-methylbut-2-enyl diphosphate reductase [Bacteroidota bacterium]MBT4408649.1 4-hydroxy-3-methylbut-2-enyl diphosphate reductase [Bacteroidota bacterium]MBT5427697.1 4-hydroxy-3-methylbut-2-enyl diphosphate reductase [Bacteroidota bacterium]MBT7093119.1 4-hydroxy-3-methylbut-2-enyl diphosphate reductase [Bacteroidota bacterium]